MRSVVVTPAAENDLELAREWYESERSGLGKSFLGATRRTFDHIAAFPEASPELEPGVRRALVNRFPFGVIYVIVDAVPRVIAVMHLHRDPDSWLGRMA